MAWVEKLGRMGLECRVVLRYDPVYDIWQCRIGQRIRGQGETWVEAVDDAWEQFQGWERDAGVE